MKSFRLMHAQNKFYFKGVSEQYIVASVAAFTVSAILTVPILKVKIMHFWQLIFLNSAY